MHTDEYTISLSRELAVCNGIIRKIRHEIEVFERRYGQTIKEYQGKAQDNIPLIENQKLQKWRELVNSISVWEQRKEEYSALLIKMKR